MSTKIQDLPFKKGIVVIDNVWKTKVKIKIKDKFFTINTPQSFGVCSAGDVFIVEKVDYSSATGIRKKLNAKRVDTTMPELLPLKSKKDVKLLKVGNGLAKILIDDGEYIVLQRQIPGLLDMEINEIQQFEAKNIGNGRISIIRKYNYSEDDIFN